MRISLPTCIRTPLHSAIAALALLGLCAQTTFATTPSSRVEVSIGYLELITPRPPLLSNVLPPPDDNGEQGAQLGVSDNNQGARFLGLNYQLRTHRSTSLDELLQQARDWHAQGTRYLVTNLSADALVRLSEEWHNKPMLIVNAGAADNQLRTRQCLNNVLHTLPSRAMLTDALGQWLIHRRLNQWLLIEGQTPEDKAYARSVRRTAKRYGAKIVAEKTWTFESDLRRTAQTEVPLFTKTRKYDAVVVADERGDFGEFIPFNTWYPRPVTGTQGLTATAWHRVVEQWGAAQLQSRFDKQAERWMTDRDYAAWAAVRAIGEAIASQPATTFPDLAQKNPQPLQAYMLSDQFQLAGFKGRKLTFRNWNGQLRQPIPLVQPRALVSQSPQQGYLHPHTDLDTLGFDRPESRCALSQSITSTGDR